MDMDRVGYEAQLRLHSRSCHGIRKGECGEECDGFSSIFGPDFFGRVKLQIPQRPPPLPHEYEEGQF